MYLQKSFFLLFVVVFLLILIVFILFYITFLYFAFVLYFVSLFYCTLLCIVIYFLHLTLRFKHSLAQGSCAHLENLMTVKLYLLKVIQTGSGKKTFCVVLMQIMQANDFVKLKTRCHIHQHTRKHHEMLSHLQLQ